MTKPISPLRQRMIDDMTFRNMSASSQKVYAYAVANFSAFHGRSPDKLGIEHVRQYRLHLLPRGLKATSINPIVGALRFFYATTLGKKEIAEQIPYEMVSLSGARSAVRVSFQISNRRLIPADLWRVMTGLYRGHPNPPI
jgi:Phage integrase, N-terminal SAM-like domain